MQVNVKHLVQVFQQSTPEEFAAEQGRICWQDEQEQFTYHFGINRHTDGSQSILGQEGDTIVFRAQVDPTGRIHSEFSTIPPERIDALLTQQAHTAKQQQSSL